MKRLGNRVLQNIAIFHQIIMFGTGAGDAGCIGFLKRIITNQMRRHLTRQTYNRNRIHQGISQTSHRIRRAWPGCHQNNTDFAGRAGIAFCGMHRGLFMPHQNMSDLVIFEQRVINRQNRATGIPKDNLNAFIL